MEQVFGLLGLVLVVFAVAALKLGPDWSQLWQETTRPTVPKGEGVPTYWYYAIALFGAALTPYEVFFYSSGAVQERWTRDDLKTNRITVLVGFPLGGLLSLSIMTTAAIVFRPAGFMVSELAHVAFPVFLALGKVGLALVIIGFFVATFGASLETALSSGYMVAQYFGWPWRNDRPLAAARFHTLVSIRSLSSPSFMAVTVGLTTLDPIKVAEFSLVFSVVALPLTYLPILVVANDPSYMGVLVNSQILKPYGGALLLDVSPEHAMNLSELLGLEVVDFDGRKIGKVREVRLVHDGVRRSVPGVGFKVQGFIVGKWTIGARLGYDQTGMKSPWMVAAIARWFMRRSVWIPWEGVGNVEGDHIALRVRKATLGPPANVRDGEAPRHE